MQCVSFQGWVPSLRMIHFQLQQLTCEFHNFIFKQLIVLMYHIHWWKPKLFLFPRYCEQSSHECEGAGISLVGYKLLGVYAQQWQSQVNFQGFFGGVGETTILISIVTSKLLFQIAANRCSPLSSSPPAGAVISHLLFSVLFVCFQCLLILVTPAEVT